MEIIKKMFLLFFIMITSIVSSQKLSKNEKEAFLMGMFNYYGGYTNIPNHPTLKKQLTYFFKSEEKLIKVFSDTLKMYSIENNIKFEIQEGRVYLRDSINPFEEYFKKVKIKDCGYSDEQSDIEYDIYLLKLKNQKLTKNQKLYFLLGAFINCGEIDTNGDFRYRYPNSDYINFIIKLLKDLKIKIINTVESKDTIPGFKMVVFNPFDELKLILEKNKNLWEQNIIRESISIEEDFPFSSPNSKEK